MYSYFGHWIFYSIAFLGSGLYVTQNMGSMRKILINIDQLFESEYIKQVSYSRPESKPVDDKTGSAIYNIVPEDGVSSEKIKQIFDQYIETQKKLLNNLENKNLLFVVCSSAVIGTTKDINRDLDFISIKSPKMNKVLWKMLRLLVFLGIMGITYSTSSSGLYGDLNIIKSKEEIDAINLKNNSNGMNEYEKHILQRNEAIKQKMKVIQKQQSQLNQ